MDRSAEWYEGHSAAMDDVAFTFGLDDITLEQLKAIATMLQPRTLEAATRDVVRAALERNGYNMCKTARELAVDRRTLYRMLERWKVKVTRHNIHQPPIHVEGWDPPLDPVKATAEFVAKHGKPPDEWLADWRGGKLQDNTENNITCGMALLLEGRAP